VSAGLQIGLGTRAAASEVLQTQGEYDNTGNALDLAIQGAGFFQVKQTNGETAYTRAGTFHTDQQGNIVTASGDPLEPSVTIPAGYTSISVGSDGTVTVTMPGQTNSQQVGSIQLATFPNPGGLLANGNNMFTPTTASGDPIVGTPGGSEGLGTLQQFMLENSNINVVDEFIQMIVTQRAYESNSKVVQAADEMLQDVNSMAK
jgi:flagellar basal-body rod protein FlgG